MKKILLIVMPILLGVFFGCQNQNAENPDSGISKNKKANSLTIDFFYVDLSKCERCQSSDETLDKALREMRVSIHQNNIDSITINKIKINSDEQAKKLGVTRSPTLRINGTDIEGILNKDYEIKDSYCSACEDVTGPSCSEVTGGGNVCRVIEYEGKTYETIPGEMIKEAIRKVVGIEGKSDSGCCESQSQSSDCCGNDTSHSSCC